MTDENLSQAEIDKIMNEVWESKGIKQDNIELLTQDQADGVVGASSLEPEPEQEEHQEEEQQEEQSGADAQGNAQSEEEEDDPLAAVDESLREKIQERLKALEEEKKKAEEERRAAVGRAAFYQRQHLLQQSLNGGDAAQKPPAYVQPRNPEEWTALVEADPEAAKAFEAKLVAEREALTKHFENQFAPVRQAYEQQQREFQVWREDQTRLVYESHPDVMDVKESPEFKQWVEGWSQQIPDFKNYLNTAHHAYGTQDKPGIVDIINQFKSDLDNFRKSQGTNQEAAQPTAASASPKATAVQEARNNKLNQAPPQRNKPAPVTPKAELSPEQELEKAMLAEMKRLGIK